MHPTACGPVAVLNALKWLGCNVSWNEYQDIFPFLGWQKFFKEDNGTCISGIKKMLKFFNIKHQHISYNNKVKIKDLEKTLDAGHAIILNYRWYNKDGTSGGHYVFIDRHTPTRFMSKNDYISGSAKGRPKKRLRKEFQKVRKELKNKKWKKPNFFIIYK